ncbi:hypothetical protein ACJJTC_001087 [Scirpophaga incertulas]
MRCPLIYIDPFGGDQAFAFAFARGGRPRARPLPVTANEISHVAVNSQGWRVFPISARLFTTVGGYRSGGRRRERGRSATPSGFSMDSQRRREARRVRAVCAGARVCSRGSISAPARPPPDWAIHHAPARAAAPASHSRPSPPSFGSVLAPQRPHRALQRSSRIFKTDT